MYKFYFDNFHSVLQDLANPVFAAQMQKYMKDIAPFYGIKQGPRRTAWKTFMKENPLPAYTEMEANVREIYLLPQREYHYCAIELAEKYKKQWQHEDISLFEFLITNKSNWDTVDYINSILIGPFFIKYPELIKSVTSKWVKSTNIWLQRSAIICQLKYKQKTNAPLLFEYCLQLANEKEFFIRKAIGWALRTYGEIEPELVLNFVNNNHFSPLSEREAIRKLK